MCLGGKMGACSARTPPTTSVRSRWPPSTRGGRSLTSPLFYQNDPSTIRRWIRQRARTGSWYTLPRSGRPRMLGPSQEPVLAAQAAAAPDATLAEHCQRWAEQTGVRVSVSTMGRWLRRLGLTRKKRP